MTIYNILNIFWSVTQFVWHQEPAEKCDLELAFVIWHKSAHHQSATTTLSKHLTMFGHIYISYLTCTYACLLHPSSFTWTPIMTHVLTMMSQTSLFFICCPFLPSQMVQSMVQQTAFLACHPNSSHSPLFVWILLVPSLLGVTRTTSREVDCDIREPLWSLPSRSPSEWLPDVVPYGQDDVCCPTAHRACWSSCPKEAW